VTWLCEYDLDLVALFFFVCVVVFVAVLSDASCSEAQIQLFRRLAGVLELVQHAPAD
jgi:hypothetical protein